MANPMTRPIPTAQSVAFNTAVCARLGIDPALVSESDFDVEVRGDEEFGSVTLTAFIPASELIELFNNAGR